ncbi:hypothetical protein AY600_01945 [Phormidium willei BDU 130791]|nr:hypothetical protein AY600_01945 [Phormidium willei BDU 130791]
MARSARGTVVAKSGVGEVEGATADENSSTHPCTAAASAVSAVAATKAASALAASAAVAGEARAAVAAAAAEAADAHSDAAAHTAAAEATGATAAHTAAAAEATDATTIITRAAVATIIVYRITKKTAAAVATGIAKHPATALRLPSQVDCTTIAPLGGVVGKSDILNCHRTGVNKQGAAHTGTASTLLTTPPLGFTLGQGQVVKVDGSRLDEQGAKLIATANCGCLNINSIGVVSRDSDVAIYQPLHYSRYSYVGF